MSRAQNEEDNASEISEIHDRENIRVLDSEELHKDYRMGAAATERYGAQGKRSV